MSDITSNGNFGTLSSLNPHVNWKAMRKWIKIILWGMVAIVAQVIFGGNILLWIIGVYFFRSLIEMLLTIALGIILYVLVYVMIFGGIFWVLIH